MVSAEPMHNAPAAATMQPSLASKEATSEEAQKGKELFLLVATSHPLIKFPFNQLHCWSGSKMVVFTYANGVQAKTNTSFLVDLKQIAELSFFGDSKLWRSSSKLIYSIMHIRKPLLKI